MHDNADYDNPGLCEDCNSTWPAESWLVVWNFEGWVCDDCRHTRILEE